MKHFDLLVVLCLWIVAVPAQVCAQDFPNLPPLTPAEITMKDKPDDSIGPAMILYYAVDTDNTKSTETHSMRIKVLNDDGKKYGDVEIPYLEKYSQIEDVRARTIALDGTVSDFTGQIYDRDIVKVRKFSYHAKVLSLPNVRVGTIVEYTYQLHFKDKIPEQFRNPKDYIFRVGITYPAADWPLQRELFVKHGRFTLTPLKGGTLRVFTLGLPSGTRPLRRNDGRVQLDVDNLPAFQEEENAPPEETLKSRVNLYYAEGFYDVDDYWIGVASELSKEYDKYIGTSRLVAAEAARIVSPKDPAETKLRKLYARVQEVREVNFENEKTDKQKKQEHLAENKNIEEVLKRGYGYGHDLDLLFIGLARAAGFDAYPMKLASRRKTFFIKAYPNLDQLSAMIVVVNAMGKLIFLDPEARFCPYGMLPWEETSSGGVIISAPRGHLADTPAPASTEAVTRTTAELHLSPEGSLKGTVKIVHEGQDALVERQWSIGSDEAERRNHLEESLKSSLAQGAIVKLVRADGWEKTGEPLSTEFEVEIQNYATQTGHRLVLPLGVFHTKEQNPFASERRIYPIYFDYPFESYEDVEIELPAGFQIEALPGAQKTDQSALFYELDVTQERNCLRVKRVRRMNSIGFTSGEYSAARHHYGKVLSGDSQQATLKQSGIGEAKAK